MGVGSDVQSWRGYPELGRMSGTGEDVWGWTGCQGLDRISIVGVVSGVKLGVETV